MKIAIIAHDAKKELMVQFCSAYCGILSKHSLIATNTTGKQVSGTNSPPRRFEIASKAFNAEESVGIGVPFPVATVVLKSSGITPIS